MKKYFYRALIILGCAVLYAAAQFFFSAAETRREQPVKFVFDGHIPAAVSNNYQIAAPLQIENVMISGTFSGWNAFDENYDMTRTTNGTWEISLDPPPGVTYYKYVVTLSNPDAIAEWANGVMWVEDVNAKKLVNDSFGGLNSVCYVPDVKQIHSVVDFFLLWAAFGLFFLTLFELFINRIMRYKISLKYKIIFVSMLIVIVSNVYFIIFDRFQRLEIVKSSLANSINTFHTAMEAGGADFGKLSDPANDALIQTNMTRFFDNTQRRYTYRDFSDDQNYLSIIILADTNGRMIAWDMNPLERSLFLYSLSNNEELTGYIRSGLETNNEIYFSRFSKQDMAVFGVSLTNSVWEVLPRRGLRKLFGTLPPGGGAVYYPVYDHYRCVGYYVAFFIGDSFVEIERQQLYTNLLVLLFFILIFTAAITRLSNIILTPLGDLVTGMNSVKNGKLDYRVEVKSSDELAVLGSTYNYMTGELKTSREKLEDYAKNLETKVEERTAELKEAQQQIIVQEKLASLGSLTAGIAHEIQNPLNFVNNFAAVTKEMTGELKAALEALPDGGQKKDLLELAADIGSNLDFIDKHGKRAAGIVSGMLLHSRSVSGTKTPLDLNKTLDEYAGIVAADYAKKHPGFRIRLDTDYDPALRPVPVFAQDIVRVFTNLLTNACYALKARHDAGEKDYVPTLALATRLAGPNVEIRVRDNGTGIPESVRPKIFTPFYTTKTGGEGTGLGLSVSYDIVVREHGGELRYESASGGHSGDKFTEFVVVLPVGGK